MPTFPTNQPPGSRHSVGVRSWQLDAKGRWTATSYVGTPRLQSAPIRTGNTALDGTGTLVSVFSAGPQGSQVLWVAVQATGDPADCIVNLFVDADGATMLFDQIDAGNPDPATVTVPAHRSTRIYRNGSSYPDWLLPAGAVVRASVTATPTTGTLNVFIQAKDF